MRVIRATSQHKDIVVRLINEFHEVINDLVELSTKTDQQAVEKVCDDVLSNGQGAVFVAKVDDDYVGIITVYNNVYKQ